MKVIKVILSLILSFLLIISSAVILSTNILESKVLDKNYMLAKLDETEFYLQISREVDSGFENYIYQSGLPEDTIQNIYTDEMIRTDVKSLLDAAYDGTEIVLSSDQVRENLDNKIQDYLNQENIQLNNQGKNNIKKFEDLIIKEYDENVNASTTLYNEANNAVEFLNEIIDKIGIIPIVAMIVIIILLVLINIKTPLAAIRYIGISLLSLGVLVKLGVNLVFTRIKFDDLIIMTLSFSHLVADIAKDVLYAFSDNANLIICAGITAIIITSFIQYWGNKED